MPLMYTSFVFFFIAIGILIYVLIKKDISKVKFALISLIIVPICLFGGAMISTYGELKESTKNSSIAKESSSKEQEQLSKESSQESRKEEKIQLGVIKNPVPLNTSFSFFADYEKTKILEMTLTNVRRGEEVWNSIKDISSNKYSLNELVPKNGMEWMLVDVKFRYIKGADKLSLHNSNFSVFNGATQVKQFNPNADPGEFLKEDIFEGGEVTKTISLYVPVGSTDIVTEYRDSYPNVYFKLT